MTKSKGGCCEFHIDGWICLRIIASIRTNILVIGLFSKQSGQEIVKCDFLNQSNHIISGRLVNLFISKQWIFGINVFSDPIVLSDEYGVIGSEHDVLVCSYISSVIEAYFIASLQG